MEFAIPAAVAKQPLEKARIFWISRLSLSNIFYDNDHPRSVNRNSRKMQWFVVLSLTVKVLRICLNKPWSESRLDS